MTASPARIRDLRSLVGVSGAAGGSALGSPSSRSGSDLGGKTTAVDDDDETEKDVRRKMLKYKTLLANDKAIIEDLRVKIAGLKKELESKDASVVALQRNYENLSALCKDDRQTIAAQQKEIADAQVAIDNIDVLKADWQTQRAAMDKEKSKLDEELLKARTETESIRSAGEGKRREYEKILAEMQRSQQMQQEEVHRAISENRQIRQDHEALKTRNTKLQMDLDSTSAKLHAEQERSQQLVTDYELLQQKYKQLESIHQDSIATKATIESNLNAKASSIQDLRTRLASLDEQTKKDAATIGQNKARLKELEAAAAAAKKKEAEALDQVKAIRESSRKEIDEGKTLAETLETKLEEALAKALGQEKAASEQVAEVASLSQQLSDKEARLAEFEASHIQRGETIDRLGESLKTTEQQLASAEEARSKLLIQVQRATSEAADLKERLEQEESKQVERRFEEFVAKEKELNATIAKLIHAEEAMEVDLTCMRSMTLFDKPMTNQDDGSTFNQSALSADEKSSQRFVPNKPLEQLVAKFAYKKQALEALVQLNKRSVAPS